MKALLNKVFWFVLPFVVVFIALELFITFKVSTFGNKARYFKKNLEHVEVLVLGSSHNQNAINPKYFNRFTANVAYGGQDVRLDSALFFNYAHKLKRLKAVILELDYTTINQKLEANYFRLPWYYHYYGVELFKLPIEKKISLYASSPTFFNTQLKTMLSGDSYPYIISANGFCENDFPGVFLSNDYSDSLLKPLLIKKTKDEIKADKSNNLWGNFSTIKSIVNYCNKNDIAVICNVPPIYLKAVDYEKPLKRKILDSFTDYLKNQYNLTILARPRENDFISRDFKDFTHLNSDGAKKYSLLLADTINKILKKENQTSDTNN